MKEEVLALLRGSEKAYVSGEAISRALGVSRAAVWKAVETLRGEGYAVSSAPNRGYRLEGEPDLLDARRLEESLAGGTLGREVVLLDSVDSTSNEVKRRAAAGAPEGLVVLANQQTKGRGRRGNSFQSLCGKGLYCSLLLRPDLPPEALGELTAWTAVALCRGLADCCGARAGIKWTNDLILEGRKLCGILTELELEAESGKVSQVVVGFGVNVGQTDEEFGPELRDKAISLAAAGRPVRLQALAEGLLKAMDRMYAQFPGAKGAYLEEYRRLCLTTGREVILLKEGEAVSAFAEEVDEHFALVVRLPDGRRERVNAGEVSVRGLMGYVTSPAQLTTGSNLI